MVATTSFAWIFLDVAKNFGYAATFSLSIVVYKRNKDTSTAKQASRNSDTCRLHYSPKLLPFSSSWKVPTGCY